MTRTVGDVTILIQGNITLGEASGELRDSTKLVLVSGAKKVLIDLGAVSYIDSAGLGELVGCFATAGRFRTKLNMLHLQKKVKGLLQITKLITVFEVFEDETEAVR